MVEEQLDGPSASDSVADLSYSSDAPLSNPDLDQFNRKSFAQRIAEIISRRQDFASMVIAIYGPWGDGKTTVLNFISKYLSENESVVQVHFNPWRLQGEDALLNGFFSTLAEALDSELKSTREKMGDLLKKYSFILKPIPYVNNFESVASSTGSILSAVSIDKLRKQISEILRASKKRVVVTIDDIDRLDRDEIQSIFRLVKLTADFDYISYLLAFDESAVAAAIGERYSFDTGQHYAAGMKFLEKIVQVGLHLPPASSEELLNYAYNRIDEALLVAGVKLSKQDVLEFTRNFSTGLAPRLKTPRMAKRYGNSLQFALGILNGEINPPDLMIVEGIRNFYPKLYLAIRDNKNSFLQRDRESGFSLVEFLRNHESTLTERESDGLSRMLRTLFPRTGTTTYGSDWEGLWRKNKKICSSDYFDRYFSYAIKSNDLSDVAIDNLLISGTIDFSNFVSKFEPLLSSRNASTFMSKLRAQEDEISGAVVPSLVKALASYSTRLPGNIGIWHSQQPFVQGAIFIAQALKRVLYEQRLALAQEVFSVCEDTAFIAECMRWMSVNSEGDDPIFSKDDEDQMRRYAGEAIIERLKQLESPIFALQPEKAQSVLNAVQWGLGNESAREYVESWIEQSPINALLLINAMKGKATNMETGLPTDTHLFRETYNVIVALAGEDKLIAALTALFGEAINGPWQQYGDNSTPLGIAREFVSMYGKVTEASKSAISKTESETPTPPTAPTPTSQSTDPASTTPVPPPPPSPQ